MIPVRLKRLTGLRRFRKAQDEVVSWKDGSVHQVATVYQRAEMELFFGRKETHWIWFIFPQGKGLGKSRTSRLYAVSDREARRFARDPELGCRLRHLTKLVTGYDLNQVFGPLDALKFRSSMALFYRVTGEALFADVVRKEPLFPAEPFDVEWEWPSYDNYVVWPKQLEKYGYRRIR